MKKIISGLLVVLLAASIALADLKDSFLGDYTASGLNVAVSNRLSEGISPEEIIATAMSIKGVDGEQLATALCDGGVPVQDILSSLNVLAISQQVAINSCSGQGNISARGSFPGAAYSSPGKQVIFSDNAGRIGGGDPIPPASGNNFSR